MPSTRSGGGASPEGGEEGGTAQLLGEAAAELSSEIAARKAAEVGMWAARQNPRHKSSHCRLADGPAGSSGRSRGRMVVPPPGAKYF